MTNNEMGEVYDWSSADGMQGGYVDTYATPKELESKASSGEQSWNANIPSQYKSLAGKWSGQQGVMKIIPMQQHQKFTYSVVADIAKGLSDPQPQIVPISDVSVVPHQISFDFFDTTEGKFGISNMTEKHMQVECDIYVSELVYFWWNHGTNNGANYKGLDAMNKLYNYMESLGNNYTANNVAQIQNFEDTTEFIKFRTSFLTQFSGWQCKFISHTFGTFNGVFTEVKYDVSSGEQFAKWHVKIEEALFTTDTGTDGIKPSNDKNTSEGDQSGASQAQSDASQSQGE